MFLAPVDIHGCISFNIIVIITVETNFLALCDKRSLQSNYICKFGKFQSVCNLL